MMLLFYVYILKCSDGSYYTGFTNNLERRLKKHHEGIYEGSYTAKRRPVTLVWSEQHRYVNNAIKRETQLKGWTRKKKEALIEGRIKELKTLAKRRVPIQHDSQEHG